MKFIGIPKKVNRKSEKRRTAIGATLLVMVVVVVVMTAQSFLTVSKTVTEPSATTDSSAETTVDQKAFSDVDTSLPLLNSRSEDIKPESDSPVLTATPAPSTAKTVAAAVKPTTAPVTKPVVKETAEDNGYYVVADLFVRSGPGTEYDQVGKYVYGDYVDTVAYTSNGWLKLPSGNYVIKDYLSSTPPEAEQSGIYYAIGEVNVRTGPGTDYDSTKKLMTGDAIEVVSLTSNGWFRTVRDTYVKMEFFSSEPPVAPTPVPTDKPEPKPEPTNKPEPTSAPAPKPGPDGMKYLGSFKVTYYGPQEGGNVITASGATCQIGTTIAVDPKVIALGSSVYVSVNGNAFAINGNGGYFKAQDTGGSIQGNIIDIFVASEEEANAMNNGAYVDVYLVS